MFPLEMHLVHNSDKNPKSLAVISALFFLQNYSNTKLDNLLIPFKYLSLEKSMNFFINSASYCFLLSFILKHIITNNSVPYTVIKYGTENNNNNNYIGY